MKIAIITNMNGIGLQRDYELLSAFLHEVGHQTSAFQWDQPLSKEQKDSWHFDLVIFLEVTPREFIDIAPVRWAFLNPEQIKPEQVKVIDRHIDRIFAKTHEAERVLQPLFGDRVIYTGFLARDQYLPEIERQPQFLHIGGNSAFRGTQIVVDAWKWNRKGEIPTRRLHVVSSWLPEMKEYPHMVRHYGRADEESLQKLQNACMFHIYPSATEGFGHAMREAQSVGAVLLVTDAPPMNELVGIYPLRGAKKVAKVGLADAYEVSAIKVRQEVNKLDEIFKARPSGKFLEEERRRIRSYFLTANEDFKKTFNDQLNFHMKPAIAKTFRPEKKDGALRIAFLGNFDSPESTENMVKWALESLGHDVEPIQENRATKDWLYEASAWCDGMFLWVHTHHYLQISDGAMDEFLDMLEDLRIPSVSLHLDKFWGIPERELRIGVEPFWHTQFVFTADGSAQEKFKERGVNHHWMKPAVSDVYCHPGVPREHWKCAVGFVGARDYHAEYPFRREMVEFLEKTYGERFKLIQGLRGHDLNDFYASCRVAVGDCIFAGTPNYWSDRLPETCGRFGFLLHPEVEGMDIRCATYTPQNLESLGAKIEHWLSSPQSSRQMRIESAKQVRKNHTWPRRMQEILEIASEKR